MLHLNHAHIPVRDVAALRDFLVQHFGFRVLATRGQDGFAVLEDAGGFVLAVAREKGDGSPPAPSKLHVGFFVTSLEAVRAQHATLRAAGIEVSEVEQVTRAGFTSVSFYCSAPGGLLLEVAHQMS